MATPLKTWVIEVHAGSDHGEVLKRFVGPSTSIESTSDSLVHVLRARPQEGEEVQFFVDHLDERFWSFHTWAGAQEAERVLRDQVGRRRDLDWTWLPSGHLRQVWTDQKPSWVNCAFHGSAFLPESVDARELKIQVRGRDPESFLRGSVENQPEFASSLAFERVAFDAAHPDYGAVSEAVTSKGRFFALGDSFALHQEIIRSSMARYRRLVNAIEAYALCWAKSDNDALLLKGCPITLQFSRPVPDMEVFLEALFSCREPFRLWGVPRELQAGMFEAEAVDLHVGQRIRIEVAREFLRLFLGPRTCGNTVVRLLTNIQHSYDSRVAFALDELQEMAALGSAIQA